MLPCHTTNATQLACQITQRSESAGIVMGNVGMERIIERKVAYYSDFEIDLADWKSEGEMLELYDESIQEQIGTVLTYIIS
jgi:hypothetical protein